MGIDIKTIPQAFELPRPRWPVIEAWIEAHLSESEREEAWESVVQQWLETLAEALEGAYHLQRSARFRLLLPDDHSRAKSLLGRIELTLGRLEELLGELPAMRLPGPRVVLLFADIEAYYDHVKFFDPPEGEFGQTSGMCIRSGYPHIAISPGYPEWLDSVIAHELAHLCVQELGLPPWLNEGLAQLMETLVIGDTGALSDLEKLARAKQLWIEEGIQDFWWGFGFHKAGEIQNASYVLAEVLVNLLVNDHGAEFGRFLREARAEDAGESAAREHLGLELGELATSFLGPGSWQLAPRDPHILSRRAAFHADRGALAEALQDYDEALRIDASSVGALLGRALLHHERGDHAAEVADCERAIEVAPDEALAHNNLAWALATCPDAEIRDGRRAVEHATRAAEGTNYETWFCLGTLAAAHAETGDFEKAIRWAEESLERAPEEEHEGCRARLSSYREGRPWHDGSGS